VPILNEILCDFLRCFESVNIIIILSQSILEVSFSNLINVITRRNRVSVMLGKSQTRVGWASRRIWEY
jgi:hypothetical protein